MNAPTKPAAAEMAAVTTIENGHPRPAIVAGSRPRPIVPTDMDQVWRFSQMVAKSGLAPKDMQKPETIMVAIMHGLEVGLTPLMALQRIAVINGRPAIWGDAAIGLVRASGLCEFVDETIIGDDDAMVATCRVKRKGEKETVDRTFSVGDAKKAGLWDKAGPWKQYPKRMLQMRARAFAMRDGFADVLGGLYIAEELEGDQPVKPMRDVTPPATVRPRQGAPLPPVVNRKQQQQATAEPTLRDKLIAEIGDLLTLEACSDWVIEAANIELSDDDRNAINDVLLARQEALKKQAAD